ncbi:beta,beta-carotene 15,15'-dioxygenase-like isoform X2 [Stegodyphus dumicola]|uniref:beta,beta-carotene 15,15'-dioxygenase-like isoform X2 n=1 Tax=Stegodyphus dumicola TaxID=202533 RepID=UPI0015AE29B5|nr:beta,beta-carotene 15,15'-dioxygenase-like isoform X2 [Stegodyphus dumicola]
MIPDRRGQIPDWVEGQLFRLGPAKWDFDNDFTFKHWLDGCALMYKFTIKKGHVDVMSRFLDTVMYQKITQVQRPVFTEFGTKSYPDPCKNVFCRYFSQLVPLELTDNDMANVYTVDDELYAASETCHLWKINPEDLTCKERIDLKELLSVNLASSHPHKCPDGTIYNLGASFMTGLRYHIMKLPPISVAPEGKKDIKGFERASILTSINSNYKASFSYYHSFGLTEHYILFLEQPLLVNTVRMAASGIKGYALKECFDWCPKEKTRFHVVDRVSGQEIKLKYQADALFFFHHINTYEEDGHIVADIMAFPGPEVIDKFYLDKLRLGQFDTTCQPIFTRFVLPLKADGKKGENLVTLKNTEATAVRQDKDVVFLQAENKGESGFEMPTINYSMFNTRKYRYVYGSGVFETGKYRNSLVKLDTFTGEMTVWREKDTMYPGEIIYVPRPGSTVEDDGVLLSVVLDVDHDSPDFLLVLDAKTFKELGRAVVPRDVHLPPTVHGCFLMD